MKYLFYIVVLAIVARRGLTLQENSLLRSHVEKRQIVAWTKSENPKSDGISKEKGE